MEFIHNKEQIIPSQNDPVMLNHVLLLTHHIMEDLDIFHSNNLLYLKNLQSLCYLAQRASALGPWGLSRMLKLMCLIHNAPSKRKILYLIIPLWSIFYINIDNIVRNFFVTEY